MTTLPEEEVRVDKGVDAFSGILSAHGSEVNIQSEDSEALKGEQSRGKTW